LFRLVGTNMGGIPLSQLAMPQAAADAGAMTLADVVGVQAPYPQRVLADAKKKYQFLNQYNPLVSVGSGDGYAETWPADEEGDSSYPRPKDFPIGRVGVQIFKPDHFGADDLAAEFLHIDPYANQTRDQLLKSMTPDQIGRLKSSSKDYSYTMQRGEGDQRATQNAIDSALRGYTTGQWPVDANQAMGYTPQQVQMLESLKSYMATGKRK
jgi:hypothetical protein